MNTMHTAQGTPARINALALGSVALVFGDGGGPTVGLAAYEGGRYQSFEELSRDAALDLYLERLAVGFRPVSFG